jgi:hypothetical protein
MAERKLLLLVAGGWFVLRNVLLSAGQANRACIGDAPLHFGGFTRGGRDTTDCPLWDKVAVRTVRWNPTTQTPTAKPRGTRGNTTVLAGAARGRCVHSQIKGTSTLARAN